MNIYFILQKVWRCLDLVFEEAVEDLHLGVCESTPEFGKLCVCGHFLLGVWGALKRAAREPQAGPGAVRPSYSLTLI